MDGPTTEQALMLFRWMKEGPVGAIPIEAEDRCHGSLQAVTWEDAGDLAALEQLVSWHQAAFERYPETFSVTPTCVRRWLVEQVLLHDDRLLFWVTTVTGERIGHVGLSHLNLEAGTVALSHLIASQVMAERLVHEALVTLTHWARETLGVDTLAMPNRRSA